MGLLEHAKQELKYAGYKPIDECEDGPNKWIQENVLELIRVFAAQGHSGMSAPYCARTFFTLASYKALSPIAGNDDEWVEVGDGMLQNKRCSALFKNKSDNKPYYIDAIIWQGEDDHDSFNGSVGGVSSRQFAKLPFRPKTFYVDVVRVLYDPAIHKEDDCVKCGDGDYVYSIKDHKQLEEVFEYYVKE